MENKTEREIKQEIRELTLSYFNKGKQQFAVNTAVPKITFDIKGNRTAGQARYSENRIRYNFPIAKQNYESFLKRTVPHEVAHIIQRTLNFNSSPHGIEWKRVMRFFGIQNPERCHDYDVSDVPTFRRSQKFRYSCACSKKHYVGKAVHNRIKNGVEYKCSRCKQIIKYNKE